MQSPIPTDNHCGQPLRVLDLFSGIGGFSLGLERAGMQTVAFCEIEPFSQKVLRKHWPEVPIYDDIRTLDFNGTVDVICGGFPCQPFSVAGKRKGKTDDRHLWPAMFSLIKKHRPSWVIGENVAGLINMALDDVLADLEGEGYTCQTFVIPACAAGAPHRRDRIWIVGNSKHNRLSTTKKQKRQEEDGKSSGSTSTWEIIPDTECDRPQGKLCKNSIKKKKSSEALSLLPQQYWTEIPVPTPRVCGVDDGISNRTHRLRALGNAVVPQIPEVIGRAIMEVEAR